MLPHLAWRPQDNYACISSFSFPSLFLSYFLLAPGFAQPQREKLFFWPSQRKPFGNACYASPGGYSPEIWVGVCGPLLETLALFPTKKCNFPYPISDLTQNSIPYFRPDASPFRLHKHLRTSLIPDDNQISPLRGRK